MGQSTSTILGGVTGNKVTLETPHKKLIPWMVNWRKIPISNNVGTVKHDLSTQLRPLIEERHFALVDSLRVSNPGLALNRSGQELGPTQPSLRSLTAIKIRFFELPHLLGAGCPIITSVFDCTPSGCPGFPACKPNFGVWP